jgi:hypothetical protein
MGYEYEGWVELAQDLVLWWTLILRKLNHNVLLSVSDFTCTVLIVL